MGCGECIVARWKMREDPKRVRLKMLFEYINLFMPCARHICLDLVYCYVPRKSMLVVPEYE